MGQAYIRHRLLLMGSLYNVIKPTISLSSRSFHPGLQKPKALAHDPDTAREVTAAEADPV